MKFRFIFFTLLVLSLALTSKADIDDLFNSLGAEIQAVWNNVVERLQNLGIDIGESVSKWLSCEYLLINFKRSDYQHDSIKCSPSWRSVNYYFGSLIIIFNSAEIGQVINSLLGQAQYLEEQSNFTLHKVFFCLKMDWLKFTRLR